MTEVAEEGRPGKPDVEGREALGSWALGRVYGVFVPTDLDDVDSHHDRKAWAYADEEWGKIVVRTENEAV